MKTGRKLQDPICSNHPIPAMRPPPLSSRASLFLDFDGTLVDLAARPDLVVVPDELPALLQKLHMSLDGALALVSGRALESLDALIAPAYLPAAGVHGAVLRTAPGHTSTSMHALGDIADCLYQRLQPLTNLVIEDKGAAIAVHYRGAPQRAPEIEAAMRCALNGHSLEMISGKFVFELRPRGINKGTAVGALMATAPFSGRLPIFVGDDTTDEDGIAVAQALGGFGIKVGEGRSAARYRLPDPAAVRGWLFPGDFPGRLPSEETP